MSTSRKKLVAMSFYAILFVLLGQTVLLGQNLDCVGRGYLVYNSIPNPRCYFVTYGTYWVQKGTVKATVDITNTTLDVMQYDIIPLRQDGVSPGINLWSTVSGAPVPAGGAVTFDRVGPGISVTATFTSIAVYNSNGFLVESSDTTFVLGELYIRAIGTPDQLDAQKDEAIIITKGYAPPVVTTALPWSYSKVSVRRSSLRSGSMVSYMETKPLSTGVDVQDKRNVSMIVNTGTPQKVKLSIVNDQNVSLAEWTSPSELIADQVIYVKLLDIFGSSMLISEVVTADGVHTNVYKGRLKVEGLNGAPVFTDNAELRGAPYAIAPVGSYAIGQ